MKRITYEQIEELRLLMQEVALNKELTDQRVVNISRKLDLLINEYYLAKKCDASRGRFLDLHKFLEQNSKRGDCR